MRSIKVAQDLPECVAAYRSITMTVSDFVVVDCATGAAVPAALEPVVVSWAWGAQPATVALEVPGAEGWVEEAVVGFACGP